MALELLELGPEEKSERLLALRKKCSGISGIEGGVIVGEEAGVEGGVDKGELLQKIAMPSSSNSK